MSSEDKKEVDYTQGQRDTLLSKLDSFRRNEGGTFIIGVDGAWGTGKTWTARRWEKMVRAEEPNATSGVICHRISAHEWELVEDPITVIIGALAEFAEEDLAGSIISKSLEVARALKPSDIAKVITQVLISLGKLGGLSGPIEAVAEAIANAQAESEKEFWNEQVQLYRAHQRNLRSLRDEIEKIKLTKAEKRRLLIVDELDRCRPEYAIRFLERLRLVLGDDNNNILVAVFAHAKALEASISHQSGKTELSEEYLSKFVYPWYQVDPSGIVVGSKRHQRILSTLAHNTVRTSDLVEASLLTASLNLSIREVEKIEAQIGGTDLADFRLPIAVLAVFGKMSRTLSSSQLQTSEDPFAVEPFQSVRNILRTNSVILKPEYTVLGLIITDRRGSDEQEQTRRGLAEALHILDSREQLF